MTCIVIEDDVVLRLIGVVLDRATPAERIAAFADYMRHDLPDFGGWLDRLRARLGGLADVRIRFVADRPALHAALPDADAVVVENLAIGADALALAPRLRIVQKFGTVLRSVDVDACRRSGVAVLTHRRRTNIAVAEHGFAMLFALSKRLHRINGLVSDERLRAAGFGPAPFDTRHTAAANWGRISGLKLLSGSRIGLVGLGEVGREMARLANAIGMAVAYTQRTRLAPQREEALGVRYQPLDDLLSDSDVVSLHVPKGTNGLIDAAAIARMKPTAILLNTARAPIVDREALLAAMNDGRIGGLAMDTHYSEPVPDGDPFLDLDNAILTPHLAGASRLNGLADIEDIVSTLVAALAPPARRSKGGG